MDGVRDLMKLVLPFTAGVAVAGLLSKDLKTVYIIAFISGIGLSAAVFLIIKGLKQKVFSSLILIISTSLLAGLLTGTCSQLCNLSRNSNMPVVVHTESLGKGMQKAVDSIGFRSKGTNAIIKALLTGEKKDIPQEITTAFRDSGASHILALSGLHLGIIYLIITKILGLTGRNIRTKWLRSAITILTCAIYSFATGASPSIIRALIFIIIGESSRLLNRKTDLKTILLSSIFIQLLLIPADIKSIGFQLSYAAIAGIAWIFPTLNRIWPGDEKKGIIKWIWNSACISISCQITTGPIAWMYFGTFPKYFLLTNLIAIPMTGLIIPASIATTLLHSIGICPAILIDGVEFLVEKLCESLQTIAAM